MCCRIKPGVQSVLGQLEPVLHNKSRVRVVQEVIFRDAIVLDGIVDDSAEESDIAARAKLAEQIRDRCGAGKARVDHDHFRVASALGFDGPLETAGVVFGRIPAHDQHHVGVFDVHPPIGHGPASEGWSQT